MSELTDEIRLKCDQIFHRQPPNSWEVCSGKALLLALTMLEKIAAHRLRHDIMEQDWRGSPRINRCSCTRCQTAREVDATLAAIKTEFS